MVSLDLLIILVFLLPGLIGAGVYRLLAVTSEFQQFDFIVFALFVTFLSVLAAITITVVFDGKWQLLPLEDIKTLIANKNAEGFKDKLYSIITTFIFSYSFLKITIISLLIGICIKVIKDSGFLFGFLRLIKLTVKTGNIDVWQDFFRKSHKKGAHLVVTLKNNEQYIGELVHHSDNPANRELVICKSARIQHNDDGSIEEVKISDDQLYLKGELIEEILYFDDSFIPHDKTRSK
ncbi:MAG: DUF6338 family protein [Candidatus Pacebacteria bacterium]|nr:DUF6338 family protein [Candidatus Paceibacterota bacterium]